MKSMNFGGWFSFQLILICSQKSENKVWTLMSSERKLHIDDSNESDDDHDFPANQNLVAIPG